MEKILIMAGGTGGHIYPALAIAKKLRDLDYEVHWLGSEYGMESKIVPKERFTLHLLPVLGFRGKSLLLKLKSIFFLFLSFFHAFNLLRSLKPKLVIGVGGFVSAPCGVIAWLLNIPLVIQEQNAIAGTTNKLLAKLATKVFEGFPNSFDESVGAIFTGNPVRRDIINIEKAIDKFKEYKDNINILVLGGSLGAKPINEIAPLAFKEVLKEKKINIWHQTGKFTFEQTKNLYEEINVSAKVEAFIEDMHNAYKWADFIICRAGALTIAEALSTGLPCIFIPLPHAIDNHQMYNALYVTKNDAGVILSQGGLNVESLSTEILKFCEPDALMEMSLKAKALSKNDATDKIVESALVC